MLWNNLVENLLCQCQLGPRPRSPLPTPILIFYLFVFIPHRSSTTRLGASHPLITLILPPPTDTISSSFPSHTLELTTNIANFLSTCRSKKMHFSYLHMEINKSHYLYSLRLSCASKCFLQNLMTFLK